ncbi:MAG: RNA methyltransferase [Archaeoglobaceae archaeon]|nr:RNA methyltransferase [Archaeoglobaceae archaeon]MDW7989507.1 RNA methyltransferase [Archaeoglobaceae archaeon]
MIHVVLVELKIPENIGFIARVLKNFGYENLYLYRCNVAEESFKTAANAKDLLKKAKIVEDLNSFLSNFNLVVGTTGISGGDYRFFRKPIITPEGLRDFIGGDTAILFGREDFGLLNEEIEKCHALVKIPTSDAYPVMNVSHAVAVILYTLRDLKRGDEKLVTAGEIEILIGKVIELFELINFPERRRRREIITLRRVLGRAKMRDYEFESIMGIFTKTIAWIKKIKTEKEKSQEDS